MGSLFRPVVGVIVIGARAKNVELGGSSSYLFSISSQSSLAIDCCPDSGIVGTGEPRRHFALRRV